MKHNFFFRLFFLAIFLMTSFNGIASISGNSLSVAKTKSKITINIIKSTMSDLPKPIEPVGKLEEHVKKPHLLKTEELAHIHHFHKERVKKLKRHHKKFWLLSKLILILCHLALMVCAYLHLSH